jgi:hypothetical protein
MAYTLVRQIRWCTTCFGGSYSDEHRDSSWACRSACSSCIIASSLPIRMQRRDNAVVCSRSETLLLPLKFQFQFLFNHRSYKQHWSNQYKIFYIIKYQQCNTLFFINIMSCVQTLLSSYTRASQPFLHRGTPS